MEPAYKMQPSVDIARDKVFTPSGITKDMHQSLVELDDYIRQSQDATLKAAFAYALKAAIGQGPIQVEWDAQRALESSLDEHRKTLKEAQSHIDMFKTRLQSETTHIDDRKATLESAQNSIKDLKAAQYLRADRTLRHDVSMLHHHKDLATAYLYCLQHDIPLKSLQDGQCIPQSQSAKPAPAFAQPNRPTIKQDATMSLFSAQAPDENTINGINTFLSNNIKSIQSPQGLRATINGKPIQITLAAEPSASKPSPATASTEWCLLKNGKGNGYSLMAATSVATLLHEGKPNPFTQQPLQSSDIIRGPALLNALTHTRLNYHR